MTTDPDRASGGGHVSPPPLKIEELSERCMGSTKVALLVLDKFAAQLAADLPALERHLAARSGPEVAGVAHALKGAAGAVAAGQLRDVAAAMETLARRSEFATLTSELSALQREVDRCLRFIPSARQLLIQRSGGAPATPGPTP